MRSITLITLFALMHAPLFSDATLPWSTNSGCKGCKKTTPAPDSDFDVIIAISFSVPDEAWVSLSREMEGKKATFAVRGLPENSFKKFAARVAGLKKKGMTAPVQVNPKLFSEKQVDAVPCFIFSRGDRFDKVSGNITLHGAEEIVRRGS
jgi:conjugal transfer pilus assembly protein TrbC